MKCYCIGYPLGHSFSVAIHEKLGLYDYTLKPLAPEELGPFLEKRDFDGINVTIPYKKAVIPYCEKISETARLCGAVNTVVNRGGRLYGYNTDFQGMKALLARGGISLAGKKVLILGTGGTSGTALSLARHLGAERVERVSRNPSGEGVISYEDLEKRADTEVILNTTPVGMFPKAGVSPVELSLFPRLSGIADAVYNPLRSEFVQQGEKRGIPSVGGLYMLVSQALFAAELFTDTSLSEKERERVYQSLLREKENLVLTGLPGCGKSTLGRLLAQRLGMGFVDSDEEIEKREGRAISEIFKSEGEAYFRLAERDVIRELSARQGLVIATGGGVPLREDNVSALHSNGRILFLDADPETLTGTASRPLARDAEMIRQRHRERHGIYVATADHAVRVSRCVEENLENLMKVIK